MPVPGPCSKSPPIPNALPLFDFFPGTVERRAIIAGLGGCRLPHVDTGQLRHLEIEGVSSQVVFCTDDFRHAASLSCGNQASVSAGVTHSNSKNLRSTGNGLASAKASIFALVSASGSI